MKSSKCHQRNLKGSSKPKVGSINGLAEAIRVAIRGTILLALDFEGVDERKLEVVAGNYCLRGFEGPNLE